MKYLPFILVLLIPTLDANEIDTNIECLAMNIYHESRGESLAGQYAVADVVLNRVESTRYPDTVCGVVKQAKLSQWWLGQGKEVPIPNMCQFSWYCDGKPDDTTDKDAWMRSVEVAVTILYDNKFRGMTEGATHYHTDYVDPRWNRNMHIVGTIGDHIFYLEKR